MSITISRLAKSDIDLLDGLFNSVGEECEIANGKFFENDNNILLVAYFNDQVSGFLYAYVLEVPNRQKRLMFLYSIDVLQKFRRNGVGTKLLESLNKIAIAENCSELFVVTNDSNNEAKRLYEKVGYKRVNLDDVLYVSQL